MLLWNYSEFLSCSSRGDVESASPPLALVWPKGRWWKRWSEPPRPGCKKPYSFYPSVLESLCLGHSLWEPSSQAVRSSSHMERPSVGTKESTAPPEFPLDRQMNVPPCVSSPVPPSDDCSPTWNQIIIALETPNENCQAESSQPAEPWGIATNYCIKPLHLEVVC